MKKLFAIIVTVAVVLCGTVPAMAAFYDNTNLVLVAYNWTDKEVAVDLGNYNTMDYGVGQTLAAAGSVNLGQFGSAVDSWDDLHVGLYTAHKDSTNVYHLVFATTENTRPDINIAPKANFVSGSTAHHTLNRGAGQVVVKAATEVNSYTNKLDLKAYGQMAGVNLYNAPLASPTLDALSIAGGFIDLYLYEWNISGVPVVGDGTDYQGIIRLNADGSIVTVAGNNPVVPIPGALVLFASGLVGLIGIRRKNA